MILVIRHDAGEHLQARRSWEALFRSLQRPEARGLRASFLNSVHPVSFISPRGLYKGAAVAYDVDLERVNRVLTRIVKGLFFHEMGYRLPDTHEVFTAIDPPVDLERERDTNEFRVFAALLTRPIIEIGDGVFSYRFLSSGEDSDSTVWLLTFYGAILAVGLTLPKNRVESE